MIKKKLSAAVLIAASLASIQSHAGVYGRVTYNAVAGDTSNDDIQFQRHEFAESIIGIKGKAALVGGLTFGANVQYGLGEGLSTGALDASLGNSTTRTRIQEITVDGGFGKISLGQGVSPSYIIDSIDSSGTWLSDPSGALFVTGSGSASHRSAGTLGVTLTSSLFHERFRYDSPKIGGIATISASLQENGGTEVAVKGKTGGFRFAAWSNNEDAQFGESSGITVGYKHPSGLSLSLTDSENETRNDEVSTVKLGYSTGKNSFSVQRYEAEGASASEATSLAYQRGIAKGVVLWARAVSAERDSVDDSDTFAIGGMFKM